jgi:hypothetical protein
MQFYKRLIQCNLQIHTWISQKHQGQKPLKSAPGGHVLGLTRGKNPAKLPLVIIFKEYTVLQMSYRVWIVVPGNAYGI